MKEQQLLLRSCKLLPAFLPLEVIYKNKGKQIMSTLFKIGFNNL